MSPRPNTFSARILTSRHALGMSKSALAREVGVSPTCIWNWEEGNTEPRADNMSALARALQVSVNFLEGGSEPAASPADETVPQTRTSNLPHLSQIIADAKETVAKAAGLPTYKVRITLDY